MGRASFAFKDSAWGLSIVPASMIVFVGSDSRDLYKTNIFRASLCQRATSGSTGIGGHSFTVIS